MLSIIIPTLNEEKNIEKLLKIIKDNEFNDYEIIIADAGSKDNTLKIAKENNCIISEGGLPAKGRNCGAEIAKGDVLLFMDADLDFYPKQFLELSMKEFDRKKIGIASFPIYPQRNNIYMNPITLNVFYNYPQFLLQKLFPMGAMAIMVKKELFNKVNGFDEKISLAEDHYFVQQASKKERFGIISSVKLYMPLRRFETDGYFRTAFKYLFCAIKLALGKPSRNTEYKFGHYKENE
ncbi:MAG: glycosyltransferase [Candidatus Pacebacteria bacterium]|nr:glycosyltransferase [Candidatus Paceibacterota bacterium]MDD4074032.1 glycosyltransferase [Candidatus Paceibacterota bacterium]